MSIHKTFRETVELGEWSSSTIQFGADQVGTGALMGGMLSVITVVFRVETAENC